MAKFNCNKCNVDFSTKGNFNRHARIYHQAEFNNRGHGSLKCPQCEDLLGTYLSLMQHLNKVHSYQLTCKHATFKSENDFKEWKTNLEMETSAEFVQNSGARRCGVRFTTHFRCHRSGKFRSRGQNKRQLKNIGSNKINEVCTAFIRKIVTQLGAGDLRIDVDYCDTHSGHSMEAERLHLPLNVKKLLAAKLAAGVSMDQILLEVNRSNSKCRRDGLVTRKDLHNIAASFNINEDDKCCVTDALKITAYVQSLRERNSPVLLFKQKGEILLNHPSVSSDDFVLLFMNDVQQYLLVEHLANGILVDSVPESETQLHGIYLTTLMVRDDNFEFYPVVLLFSSSKSSEVLLAVFKEVRARLGGDEIKPSVFMSDDDPAYYLAWKSCFGEVEHNLICSWHVFRVWEQYVMSVEDENAREAIKQDLCYMQQELEVNNFNLLLETNCRKWIECETTAEFGKYFKSNFAERKRQWAFCYQISAHVNTYTLVSGWHAELKECSVENGMVIKRLDKCLNSVMLIFNKKIEKLNLNCSKFRFSAWLLSTRQRHRMSCDLNLSHVYEVIPRMKWLIPSSSSDINADLSYYQVVAYELCGCQRQLVCPECDVCVHQFHCQCVDHVVRYQICEHIHLISRLLRTNSVDAKSDVVVEEFAVDHSSLRHVLDVLAAETQTPISDADSFQSEMMGLLMDYKWMINETIKCQTVAELQTIRSGIETVMSSLEAHRTHQLNAGYNLLIASSNIKEEPHLLNKRSLQRILPKEVESGKSAEMENKTNETPLFLIIGV